MRAVSWPQTGVGPRCRPLDVRAGRVARGRQDRRGRRRGRRRRARLPRRR
nr:MAG TPA: hypothetical protein [Caudoviricetes sp.]